MVKWEKFGKSCYKNVANIVYILKGGILMKTKPIKFNHNAVTLLMNTSREEYNNELSRTTTIDNKTNISLPIISAYFFMLAQSTEYRTLFDVSIDSFDDLILPTVFLLLYISSLVLSFFACIEMIKVIFFKKYITINVEDLYNDDFLKRDSAVLSTELIGLYAQAISHNKTQNDSRIRLYKNGWILAVLSISLFVMYILLK